MKPPKPRIVKPRLKWIWSKGKNAWEPYHRVTWNEDGRRRERNILLNWKGDPKELDRLFWQCGRGDHEKQKPPPSKFTWGVLVQKWRSDPRVQKNLKPSTKVSYRREMDFFLQKNQGKDVRKTTRSGMRSIHEKLADTPRKADKLMAVVKLLWNYGKNELDWPIGDNPVAHIRLYGRQSEFLPWPEWLVDRVKTAPVKVRTAVELILGTGQRPGAAINMKREAFRGTWVEVMDEKSDQPFEIYFPTRLREYVEELPRTGAYVLEKNLTQPLGYDAVEKDFRAWRNSLGDEAKKYSLHGLRKLAIIQMAEAGCTDAEIQAVTNQSAETVTYYRKLASRKILSKNAAKRNENKT